MAALARDEVAAAFRVYWQTGAVGEDWDAWADLFTEDAVHLEHILGRRQGREEINRRDDPSPGGGTIDFPGVTILLYAGEGRWSYEEDY